jgi:histidinol-phosphatase
VSARVAGSQLEAWLAFALACCDEADALALAHFRRDLVVEAKPDRTFVTEADRAIERRIRERIADAYPGHGIVGEEYGSEAGQGSARWYVDPIDGTHNFMRGVPLFGTLLALEAEGELQVGVISAPALGGRWFARRGGGAWAIAAIGAGGGERRPIAVSKVSRLGDAHLLYGSAQEIVESGGAPGFQGLIGDVWRDRGFGDFWGYALVAEGAAEAMVEVGPKSWDLAAPLVVVEEAGGRLTDLDGQRTIHSGTVVATNGALHEEVLARLRIG